MRFAFQRGVNNRVSRFAPPQVHCDIYMGVEEVHCDCICIVYLAPPRLGGLGLAPLAPLALGAREVGMQVGQFETKKL